MRGNKSISGLIFTVIQLIEKSWEFAEEIILVFTKFGKVYHFQKTVADDTKFMNYRNSNCQNKTNVRKLCSTVSVV